MGSESTVIFDSDDVDEAESFLRRTYSTVCLDSTGKRSGRLYVRKIPFGPLDVDETHLSYGVSWRTDPIGAIRLSRVNSGAVAQRLPDGSTECYARGDVMIVGSPERPFAGRCDQTNFELILVRPDLLERLAAAAPSRRAHHVRLTGHRPISPAAHRRISAAIDYVRTLATCAAATAAPPLVAATAADHLCAVLLNAFPNTALLDPTIEDRHDATPVLLRRAIAFIDDNAHTDISLKDIAAAVYITPRALQYMFAHHQNCTPMQYVRRVRLSYAHRDLITGNDEDTVAEIARRWGFGHPGRFALLYRQTYGRSPNVVLRPPPD